MTVTLLELRHISKTYEGEPLLKDISFMIKADETICLLGASGSGKSTLLRMIAGLELPDDGLILFNGVSLASIPPHARDFGLVFQDYGLFPHLNVFDNIAFALKIRQFPFIEIKERVATLVEQVGLLGFEHRKVTDLSGGEQQRVALARALANQPRLLMFDEPLGALDRSLKEGLLNELRTILHKTKIPAIYVTHDQEEAFTIADRILLLHDGAIILEGTPEDVWSNPRLAWAARFLGVGNVVEGVVNTRGKVKTDFGILDLKCRHKHVKDEQIFLLFRQIFSAREKGGSYELKLKVEDVLFNREQFQVHVRGGLVIHMKEKPKVGQIMRLRMKVECLA
jgi:spermidine/putrescine transport system ATP-binding protein